MISLPECGDRPCGAEPQPNRGGPHLRSHPSEKVHLIFPGDQLGRILHCPHAQLLIDGFGLESVGGFKDDMPRLGLSSVVVRANLGHLDPSLRS